MKNYQFFEEVNEDNSAPIKQNNFGKPNKKCVGEVDNRLQLNSERKSYKSVKEVQFTTKSQKMTLMNT